MRWVERNVSVDREVGDRTQGFRRMAARNKPTGIRVVVYGIGKGKAVIEGLSVSGLDQAEQERLLSRFLTVTDGQGLVDPHGLVANR